MYFDVFVVIAIVLAAVLGLRRGMIAGIFDILGTVITLFFGLQLYPYLSDWLVDRFAIAPASGALMSLLIIIFVFHLVWTLLSDLIIRRIPENIRQSLVNRLLGILPNVFYFMIYLGVIAWFLLRLPSAELEPIVNSSKLINPLAKIVNRPLSNVGKLVDNAIQEVETAHVGPPIIGETRRLNIPVKDLQIDAMAEADMLTKLNEERVKNGLKPLVFSEKLREVARSHADDMWRRQYFSHTNPDGKSPFDRLKDAKIVYLTAGENLALAPTTDLAHDGLMASPGHRANILYPHFGKVGIGAVNAGRFKGIMYVQMYSN